MKIRLSDLRRIIKEEVERVLLETNAVEATAENSTMYHSLKDSWKVLGNDPALTQDILDSVRSMGTRPELGYTYTDVKDKFGVDFAWNARRIADALAHFNIKLENVEQFLQDNAGLPDAYKSSPAHKEYLSRQLPPGFDTRGT
jgi:hypothetical protein